MQIVKTGRSKPAVIGAIGVAGIIGGLVAGGGVFANAAGTTPTYTPDATACSGAPAVVPAAPVFKTTIVVGGTKASGVIPAPTATQLAALGLTVKDLAVNITTQYNSGRSGAGKTDVVTVNLPGHQYNNPLLFNIPPVSVGEIVGTGSIAYSAQTTGKAYATVTVTETVADGIASAPEVVLGDVCPTGTVAVGVLQGNFGARPATPTAVTETAGGTVVHTTSDPARATPNNGAVTVKFTPSTTGNGGQVDTYEILPIDTTDTKTVQEPELFVAPTDTTSTTQQTATVDDLNTNDSYLFEVFALTSNGLVSTPTAVGTALKPVAETVPATGTTNTGSLVRKAGTVK